MSRNHQKCKRPDGARQCDGTAALASAGTRDRVVVAMRGGVLAVWILVRGVLGAEPALEIAENAKASAPERTVSIRLSETQTMEGVRHQGALYVDLTELSRAVSTRTSLPSAFVLDGTSLSTAGLTAVYTIDRCAGRCLLTLRGNGRISAQLVRLARGDSSETVLVPLTDLAAAMGRSIRRGSDAWIVFLIDLAPGEDGTCRKCLLQLNPRGVLQPRGVP
jgi:hypothetical protein